NPCSENIPDSGATIRKNRKTAMAPQIAPSSGRIKLLRNEDTFRRRSSPAEASTLEFATIVFLPINPVTRLGTPGVRTNWDRGTACVGRRRTVDDAASASRRQKRFELDVGRCELARRRPRPLGDHEFSQSDILGCCVAHADAARGHEAAVIGEMKQQE